MKKHNRKLWLGALSCLLLLQGRPVLAAQPTPTLIVVDGQKGQDTNPGSAEAPVQTLAQAQKLAREKTPAMESDIQVVIKAGTYTLEQPLVFNSADSGQNGFSILWTAAPGEEVQINGARSITGWTLHDEVANIWKADAKNLESRDLYVNGQRAQRARSPISAYEFTRKYIYVNNQDLPKSFAKPNDLEVVFGRKWKWAIHKVDSIGENSDYENCSRIKITNTSFNAMQINLTGAAIDAEGMAEGVQYLENAYELLDEPGEWYLNSEEEVVYYKPQADQNMTTINTQFGLLENLIRFEGTPDAPVSNIALEGLSFVGNTWNKPSHDDGLQTFQGSAIVKWDDDWNREWIPSSGSAIFGEYTQNITLRQNTFTNLGATAVHLGRAAKQSTIERNTFTNLGGGAIILGNVEMQDHLPTWNDLTSDNVIINNTIDTVAQTYRAQTGILAGFTRNTTISHNTLTNLPYTAISMGWGWGYNDFNANTFFRLGHSSIIGNSIKDCLMEESLIDGGGIYTLGRQDNSIIKDNYIDGVHNEYGGIYLDEGSVGFTITNNVLTNCTRNWLYKGDQNFITNNFAAPAKEPDRDERLPISDKPEYRFENNNLWDESKVNAIREAAGVQPIVVIPEKQILHRLYNRNSGEHFYTADTKEKAALVKLGWTSEGIGWTAPATSAHPVYRLYNPNAGDHHYTLDIVERQVLIELGWNDEGIGWYSDVSKTIPLYRLYNPNAKAGSHHYTVDEEEYKVLSEIGWKPEGISWYGM